MAIRALRSLRDENNRYRVIDHLIDMTFHSSDVIVDEANRTLQRFAESIERIEKDKANQKVSFNNYCYELDIIDWLPTYIRVIDSILEPTLPTNFKLTR